MLHSSKYSLVIAFTLIMTLLNAECTTKKSAKDSILYQTEFGMAPNNNKDEDRSSRVKKDHFQSNPESEQESDDNDLHMVTIDLSALRPSLPGLVLYRYGEMAPKLVQIDLDALNPELQPHVIWPQFQQQIGDLEESYYDFIKDSLDAQDAIPLITGSESLVPTPNQKFAKMTSVEPDWPNIKDLADGDIYDFMPDSIRNEEMMILQQSLPLADEVIVPLDWENDDLKSEKGKLTADGKGKRNVFVSQSWKPGGYSHRSHKGLESTNPRVKPRMRTTTTIQDLPPTNHRRPVFGSNGWRPGKRRNHHTDHKNIEREGPDETVLKTHRRRRMPSKGKDRYNDENYRKKESNIKEWLTNRKFQKNKPAVVRISSQETWTQPKQQWGAPMMFSTY